MYKSLWERRWAGKGGLGECNCRESWGPAIFSGDLSKRERGDQVRGERERGDQEGRPKGWYLQGTNQYRLRGRQSWMVDNFQDTEHQYIYGCLKLVTLRIDL